MSVTDEKQVLAGLVERVTFHNEENGFCVLRVKVRGQKDLITSLVMRRRSRLANG
jgi:exodeoxyribonuclease V alpha subunit